MCVEVRDDGVGGARPDGSGLIGLADRLAVLDGTLRVDSPAGGGTLVAADIPLPARDRARTAARPPLRARGGLVPSRCVDEQLQTFEFAEASVTLPVPAGAAFAELEGLDAGARHLTWAPAPEGYFMLSAGASPGHTADGLLSGEAERERGLRVASDEPAPGRGPRCAARRVQRDAAPAAGAPRGGRTAAASPSPERDVRQLSDLLFVPGERQHLRVGYRVDEDAPGAVRDAAGADARPRRGGARAMREPEREREAGEPAEEAAREQPAPQAAPIAQVMALQRSAGNRAVAAALARHDGRARAGPSGRRDRARADAGRTGGGGAGDVGAPARRARADAEQHRHAHPEHGPDAQPAGRARRGPAGQRAADDAALGLEPGSSPIAATTPRRPRTSSTARTRTTGPPARADDARDDRGRQHGAGARQARRRRVAEPRERDGRAGAGRAEPPSSSRTTARTPRPRPTRAASTAIATSSARTSSSPTATSTDWPRSQDRRDQDPPGRHERHRRRLSRPPRRLLGPAAGHQHVPRAAGRPHRARRLQPDEQPAARPPRLAAARAARRPGDRRGHDLPSPCSRPPSARRPPAPR